MRVSFANKLKTASSSELLKYAQSVESPDKLYQIATTVVDRSRDEAESANFKLSVSYIKLALIKNEHSGRKILKLFSTDRDPLVREEVVRCPRVPGCIINAMKNDASFEVARSYPKAKNVSEEAVKIMADRIMSGDIDITDTALGEILLMVSDYVVSNLLTDKDVERLNKWVKRLESRFYEMEGYSCASHV